MKLFLAQNANFSMTSTSGLNGGPFCFGVTADQLQPSLPDNPEEVQACKDLSRRLHLDADAVGQESPSSDDGQSKECQWMVIDLRSAETSSTGQPRRHARLERLRLRPTGTANNESEKVLIQISPGPVTDALVDLFGRHVTLQVQISNMYCEDYGDAISEEPMKSPEMDIRQDKKNACEAEMTLYYYSGPNLNYFFSNGWRISGNITMTVTVGEKDVKLSPGLVVNDRLMIFKKMLQDEIGTDVVIISQKGEQVKAHKSVLSTHSEVFAAVFQSDMKEAKTHTIKMPDMSEQSVRAMLAYLYYWDETEPDSKPVVAYEMLCAGHKYIIPVLETAMKKLLLGKPNKWYDADVAMKLFLLAKNLPTDGDPLKMKAIKVLKMNFKTLERSPTYTALFNEDPKAAMELCKFAFAA